MFCFLINLIDFCFDLQSLHVRDIVRDSLEKDPGERTPEDLEILLEFTQKLEAFNHMTMAVRRALCSVMVFAVVEKAGTTVMMDGEELDSWSVIINGKVQIESPDYAPRYLECGDSFGIEPNKSVQYHKGIMKTIEDDCQFVCITQVSSSTKKAYRYLDLYFFFPVGLQQNLERW